MGSMDDMLKGLQVFKDGMTQYHTTEAISDANAQLTALNGQAMDKAQAIQAHQQLASNLAMRLTAAGTDAAHIQNVASALAPSQNTTYQGDLSQQLQKQSETAAAAAAEKQQASAKDIAQMHMDAMSGKAANAAYTGEAKNFEKRPEVAGILKSYPDISNTLDELRSGKDQPESVMFSNLAKIGMLKKANGGRPSQQEFATMTASPAWYDAVRTEFGLQTTNALPADKQQFWDGILSRAKSRMSDQLGQLIDSHAQGAAEMNNYLDRGRLNQALRDKYSNIVGTPGGQAPAAGADKEKIGRLQTWLNSPEATKDPVKTQQAKDVLKKLQDAAKTQQGN